MNVRAGMVAVVDVVVGRDVDADNEDGDAKSGKVANSVLVFAERAYCHIHCRCHNHYHHQNHVVMCCHDDSYVIVN